jgi:hypothetical protein
MIIPFVGDAYKARSINLNAQTCINLYLVMDQYGGKTPTALYRTPGLTLFSDDNDANYSVRGLIESNNVLYGVIDDKFYSFNVLGERTELGSLLTASGRVEFEANGIQIAITEEQGENYYVYTIATNTFQQNPTENFPRSIAMTYQDGYGILPQPNSTQWFITDLFDFSTIDPLEFASANTSEDYLVTAISRAQELFLIKTNSTEVWYDTGAADFPFERRQTLILRYGIAAPYSLVRIDNNILMWLGRNEHSKPTVVLVDGYNMIEITDEGVALAINSYDIIDDAFAFAYKQDDNHLFYVLTFPTADRTWVYDLSTKAWHERRSQINNTMPAAAPTRQGRWRANCYAFFNGQHVVGDFESGKLFYVDINNYTDNGTPITWERTAYHLSKEERFVECAGFQLIIQSGVGLTTGQGSDPIIMLQWSKDYGYTFSPERPLYMGKKGEYKKRLKAPALGTAQDWVFRIRGTDPVFVAILGARADMKEGEY